MTPGNFLAEKTWNGSEKTEANTGAVPWLMTGAPFVDSVDGVPTLTKLIFRLILLAIALDTVSCFPKVPYRKVPSVRTLRSCRINHTPILLSGSVNRKALALRLPIKFRVNIPPGPPDTGCAAGDMDAGI